MAGNFEKLVKSQDIFINTQQSGDVGASAVQKFGLFKVCFNQYPLQCSANQFIRLSVSQFFSYRNWYYVNKTNNLLYVRGADAPTTNFSVVRLGVKDYIGIGGADGISTNFAQKMVTAFTGLSGSGDFPAITFASPNFTDNTTPETTGGTGNRLLDVDINLTSGNAATFVANLIIQCPQFQGTSDSQNADDNFNDSYALLGGRRNPNIGNHTYQAFNITATDTNTINIKGYYPMQRTTTPYLYLRCSHNGNNLETQNHENYEVTQDEHVINSTIVAKMPVNDNSVTFQFDALSPYFVDVESRFISELDFRITDGHGRQIPLINDDIDTEGNLFCNMTIKANTYEVPPSPYELQTTPPAVPLFDKQPYNITYSSNQRPNPYARNV
jgi:hypothetical protein